MDHSIRNSLSKKQVNYNTSPYDLKNIDLKSWLGTFDNETYITDISLPGSFNSMTGDVSKIYAEHNSIQGFLQTVSHVNSNFTIEDQLKLGVRAFDFRVFHISKTESDRTKHKNYYYCDKLTSLCYDFRFVSDVFPVSNYKLSEVMGMLQKFLSSEDSKHEYLFIRLTCEPWEHCEYDPIMGNLIVGFFQFYVGTNQPLEKWKVRPVSQMSGIKIKDVRGQILVNYRHFPLGNQI